jgi:tRNA modification GTPase
MILEDLVARGCERVAAVDFPMELDCEFKREAAIDLQRATSDRAAAILLDQLNGALGEAVARITDGFRSQGPAAVRGEVASLLRWSELGRRLTEPWQIVLAGPPNAGKSSLVNAIAGSERVIVHAEPGTTRDWVEVLTAIDGWPVGLSDTAGIRETNDAIEREGISRALQRVAAADLVVFVVDATVGWTETHDQLKAAAEGKRTLVVWNKIDLWTGEASVIPPEVVCTSTCKKIGIDKLLIAIGRVLVLDAPPANAAVPFRERHLELLRRFL